MTRPLPLVSILTALSLGAVVSTVAADTKPPESSPSGLAAFWDMLKNADGSSDVTAVWSTTYNGYKRTRLPDGSFRPESYAFGEGGYGASPVAGEPAEDMKFMTIVRTIAGPLAGQGYVPTKGRDETDLLIMVYWGVTNTETSVSNGYNPVAADLSTSAPAISANPMSSAGGGSSAPSGPTDNSAFDMMIAFQNEERDRLNDYNARLLGYYAEYSRTAGNYMLRDQHSELVSDLEDPRYYVVLLAFDFKKILTEKRRVLLWTTRYSIRERNNDFEHDLAAMTRRASQFFGRDSHGLKRDVPFRGGNVELGDLKVVGFDSVEVRKLSGPEDDKNKPDSSKH